MPRCVTCVALLLGACSADAFSVATMSPGLRATVPALRPASRTGRVSQVCFPFPSIHSSFPICLAVCRVMVTANAGAATVDDGRGLLAVENGHVRRIQERLRKRGSRCTATGWAFAGPMAVRHAQNHHHQLR